MNSQDFLPSSSLKADIVLWPVWCDYDVQEWNKSIKNEYAQQASFMSERVILVNPYCLEEGYAKGGSAYFKTGVIVKEVPAGKESTCCYVI